MFHGEDCEKNSPISMVTWNYLTVAFMISYLEYAVFIWRLSVGSEAFSLRTRNGITTRTPLVVAFCMAMYCLTNFVITLIHSIFQWKFLGHWYKEYGFVILTNLAVFFLGTSVAVVVLDFYSKLVSVQVVTNSYASKVILISSLVMMLTFLAVVYCVYIEVPFKYSTVLVVVPPFFAGVSCLSLASGRLKATLEHWLNEQMHSHDRRMHHTLKAVKELNRFANEFQTFLTLLFFMWLLSIAFEINPSIPDAIAHLTAVATIRMHIHVSQIMMKYCLPGRSSLVLILPEERLWQITIMLFYIIFWFCSEIIARTWEILCWRPGW